MKQSILIISILFVTSQLFSVEKPTTDLPIELKEIILQFSTNKGSSFEESIQNIKNIISINKDWSRLLDKPNKIEPLLVKLSQQWNIPKTAIAFALGTSELDTNALGIKGAQEWLKQKDPNFTLLKIFEELTQEKYLNSDFFNSKYFTKLTNQLGKKTLIYYANEILKRNDEIWEKNRDLIRERGYIAVWPETWEVDKLKKFPDLYEALKNYSILEMKLDDLTPEEKQKLLHPESFGFILHYARPLLRLGLIPKYPELRKALFPGQ